MTVQTITSARTDDMFDLFWAKVTQRATFFGFTDPPLPHCRKQTRRYDDGESVGDFHRGSWFYVTNLLGYSTFNVTHGTCTIITPST